MNRAGEGTTSGTGSPRARKRRASVEHLLALAAAEDYRALYVSLLAALPRCMGECGRPARYMTTYSSEFSCGRAGCEQPDHEGDKWLAAPWKDHVDAAEALSPPGRRARRQKNNKAASALEVTAEDRAMASAHDLMFKHEDDVGGVAVGPVSWVAKGSALQRAGYVRSRDEAGSPAWFAITDVRAFATALGIGVVEV